MIVPDSTVDQLTLTTLRPEAISRVSRLSFSRHFICVEHKNVNIFPSILFFLQTVSLPEISLNTYNEAGAVNLRWLTKSDGCRCGRVFDDGATISAVRTDSSEAALSGGGDPAPRMIEVRGTTLQNKSIPK